MNLIADINILRFFELSNLSPPYERKLIGLLSLTAEKQMVIFSKLFIRVAQYAL